MEEWENLPISWYGEKSKSQVFWQDQMSDGPKIWSLAFKFNCEWRFFFLAIANLRTTLAVDICTRRHFMNLCTGEDDISVELKRKRRASISIVTVVTRHTIGKTLCDGHTHRLSRPGTAHYLSPHRPRTSTTWLVQWRDGSYYGHHKTVISVTIITLCKERTVVPNVKPGYLRNHIPGKRPFIRISL